MEPLLYTPTKNKLSGEAWDGQQDQFLQGNHVKHVLVERSDPKKPYRPGPN